MTTIQELQRAALITEISLWSPSRGHLAPIRPLEDVRVVVQASGHDCEAVVNLALNSWRLSGGQWTWPLALRLSLEDGSHVAFVTEWKGNSIPEPRLLAQHALVRQIEAPDTPVPLRVDAHRVLELLAGQAVPCLWGPNLPLHLEAALADLPHSREHSRCITQACHTCSMRVGHIGVWKDRNTIWVPHQHFLSNGNLCEPKLPGQHFSATPEAPDLLALSGRGKGRRT
jgi:hypothetical protein